MRQSEYSIRIGLVNNMPDAALEATEQQFAGLLGAAAEDMPVQLSLFALPGVPRSEEGKRRIDGLYCSTDTLGEAAVDALIVTGAEPLCPNLKDEPYWNGFARLVDWAEENTYSAIWSCLAAHAAVLHTDGIPRQRLSEKLFGVFESETVAEHYLTSGLPGRHWMPHSRWNGIAEEALTARGYRILTRAEDAGVDTFIRKGQSQFVFFQGHPEYEAATLLREYRRDIRRFLRRETEAYPAAPRAYFDENCAALLAGMKRKAHLNREEEALADFPSGALASTLSNSWRSSAVSVYRNWLSYLSAQKYQRLRAPYVAEAALRESA